MTRIKTGTTRRRRHKKVLEQTKGHKASRHLLFRRARESLIHSLAYAYRDRRDRKGDFRRLWNVRINAAARKEGISYSRFIEGLRKAQVSVDRKILAELAVNDPQAFSSLVSIAKEHTSAPVAAQA